MSDVDDDDEFGDRNDRLSNHSCISDKSTITKGKTALNHFDRFCKREDSNAWLHKQKRDIDDKAVISKGNVMWKIAICMYSLFW